MSAAVLAALHDLVSALVAAGVPPPSPYWLGECERFYTHPMAHLLVECAGRGADKSRVGTPIMGVAETLAGDFTIPPGERHYFVHVSENKDEAAKTLAVLEQYLRIWRIPFHRSGDTIDLDAMPRGFKVLACRVAAVSGFRCYGWTADECAKWEDEGSDPSAEVIASIKAMTITHPNARGRMFSSPLAASGYFHETWSAGETAGQLVGHAPSWVANVSITEERTRELEPHEPTRLREYGAVPGAGSSDALDPADVAAMVRPLGSVAPLGAAVLVIDSSSGRHDGWSFARARYVREDGRRVLHVDHVGAFEGAFGGDVSFDYVVAHIAALARRFGASRVFGDQHLAFALASGFAAFGLPYVERPWSQPTKIEALSTLRRLLRERTLVVEPGEQADALRRELLTLREVLLPSKVFTVQARRTGRGHADRASLALMVARCVAEGDILGGGVEHHAADGMAPVPGTRPMTIATRFGVGLGSRFESHDWLSPPRSAPAPRLPQEPHALVPNGPGQQPTVVPIPQPPSFAPPGAGGRGWGGSGGGWGF